MNPSHVLTFQMLLKLNRVAVVVLRHHRRTSLESIKLLRMRPISFRSIISLDKTNGNDLQNWRHEYDAFTRQSSECQCPEDWHV